MTEAPIADHGLIADWQTAALAPLSDEAARPRSAVQLRARSSASLRTSAAAAAHVAPCAAPLPTPLRWATTTRKLAFEPGPRPCLAHAGTE
jgi:hypothetical protein